MEQRRDIRWNLVATSIVILLFYWITDAYLDAYFSSDGKTFLDELLHPDLGELLVNLFVDILLLYLIWMGWRKASQRDQLAASLEQTLAELAAEKSRTEAMLAAMPDAVSVQDTDLKILYQNSVHKALMGDHLGEYCYMAYQHRDTVCPGCHLVQAFVDGQPHRREVDQAERGIHVEILASPLKDASGRVVAGIESVRDVTDRKKVESCLQRQHAAFEASMDGIAVLNAAGEYLYLNRSHALVYGYPSPEELVGKTWHVLYAESERQRLESLIYSGLEHHGCWRGEAVGLRKDGSLFPQEISLSALNDGGIVCVVRDITDRKRAEAEICKLNDSLCRQTIDLQATNRNLEAFGYSLSHDLRSPLTGIYVAAQTLDELCREHLDDTGISLLGAIRQSCERMEDLIEAMLALFQVTRSELIRSDVDLSAMADEVVTQLRLRTPERSVECRIAAGMIARVDSHQARILLENLFGNAWKYTAKTDAPLVEFGCQECDGEQRFFVRDNGAGFDMKDVERIFKPFQRLHRSSDFPGTGVGLATVQRIVDRHGGRIWAEGAVGKGASIYFTIPASDEPVQGGELEESCS